MRQELLPCKKFPMSYDRVRSSAQESIVLKKSRIQTSISWYDNLTVLSSQQKKSGLISLFKSKWQLPTNRRLSATSVPAGSLIPWYCLAVSLLRSSFNWTVPDSWSNGCSKPSNTRDIHDTIKKIIAFQALTKPPQQTQNKKKLHLYYFILVKIITIYCRWQYFFVKT